MAVEIAAGGKSPVRALEYKNSGNESFARADYRTAIECYSHAIRFLPPFKSSDGADPHSVLRSVVYYNRAQSCMHHLLMLKSVAAGAASAIALLMLKSVAAGAASAIADEWIFWRALYDCNRSLSANPKYAKARQLRAELYAHTKQYQLAITEFKLLPPAELTAAANAAYKTALQLASDSDGADEKAASTAAATAAPSLLPSVHPSIACANPKLRIDRAASRGRFMTAAQPLASGDVLIDESPFAAVLNRTYRVPARSALCDWCFTALESSSESGVLWWEACETCAHAVYCSSQCRTNARTTYHHFECQFPELFAAGSALVTAAATADAAPLSDETILTVRIWLRGAKAESTAPAAAAATAAADSKSTVTAVDTPRVWRGDYSDVQSLLSHASEMAAAASTQYATEIDRIFSYFKGKAESKSQAPGSDDAAGGDTVLTVASYRLSRAGLLHHRFQTQTNVYAVTRLVSVEPHQTETKSKSKSKSKAASLSGSGYRETAQVRVAVALYPTASLLNHSCQPNVVLSYSGRRLVIRACERIASGHEILNCYGPHTGHQPTAERQLALKSQYFFDCDCTACKRRIDFIEFACENPKCEPESGGYYQLATTTTATAATTAGALKCVKCGHVCADAARLRKFEALTREYSARGDGAIANGKLDDAIGLFSHGLELCSKLFAPTHKSIAASEDALGRAFALKREWKSAIGCVYRSTQLLERIFGRQSIEVAREYAKLAVLCVNGRESVQAIDAARRAIAIFDSIGIGKPIAAAATAASSTAARPASSLDDWSFNDLAAPSLSVEQSEYAELHNIISRLKSSPQ